MERDSHNTPETPLAEAEALSQDDEWLHRLMNDRPLAVAVYSLVGSLALDVERVLARCNAASQLFYGTGATGSWLANEVELATHSVDTVSARFVHVFDVVQRTVANSSRECTAHDADHRLLMELGFRASQALSMLFSCGSILRVLQSQYSEEAQSTISSIDAALDATIRDAMEFEGRALGLYAAQARPLER